MYFQVRGPGLDSRNDRTTNFSSAYDFSIRSDSTNNPALIGSWSWAILLATWIGVGSEISSQQLVILSVISPQLKSTNYRKHLLEHGLSCVNSLYIFNDVIHIHIPVKYGMSKACCIVSKYCVRALNWPWRSRIGTHKWRRHTSHCDIMNRYHQSDVFHSIMTT